MGSKLEPDKYKQALELVSVLFKNINRKITEKPFIVHLVGVSYIVQQVTNDKEIHIAALLHDVLEDIPSEIYNEDHMRHDYGVRITEIVKTVTHVESTYGKEESRKLYLEQLRHGPVEACIVSAADMLNNAIDMVQLYDSHFDEFKNLFGGEKAVTRMWFWGERMNILRERLGKDHAIIVDLHPIFVKLDSIHQKIQ